MKPAAFDYCRAGSLDEALESLAQFGDDARLLAGGQSLVPMMNLRLARPAMLIDVNRLPLDRIAFEDGVLRVGALARHAGFLANPEVARAAPVVPEALAHIAHPTIRQRGTAGGSVAHADPTAEIAMLLLLFDGEVCARSAQGERRVPASRFFRGAFTTDLADDEMITDLGFTIPGGKWGAGFLEISERSGDFAIAAACAALSLNADDEITSARIVLASGGPAPVRAGTAEAQLVGEGAGGAPFAAAASAAAGDIDCHGDIRASAGYRRHLLETLTADALRAAHARAREAV